MDTQKLEPSPQAQADHHHQNQPNADGQQQPLYPAQPTMRYPPAPNPHGLPVDSIGERGWSNGFCQCHKEIGYCCSACWLGCPTYSLGHSKLRALRNTGYPHPTGGESCSAMAWAFCAVTWCTGFGWVMATVQRGEVRDRYRIRGNGCLDCLAATFCFPCAQVQQLREIEDEERFIFENQKQPQLHPTTSHPAPHPKPEHASTSTSHAPPPAASLASAPPVPTPPPHSEATAAAPAPTGPPTDLQRSATTATYDAPPPAFGEHDRDAVPTSPTAAPAPPPSAPSSHAEGRLPPPGQQRESDVESGVFVTPAQTPMLAGSSSGTESRDAAVGATGTEVRDEKSAAYTSMAVSNR